MTRPAVDSVADEIAELQSLNIDELRNAWRRRLGTPPMVRSGDFLRRCLAEKIQLHAYGGDPELDEQLRALVRSYERSGSVRSPGPKLKPGAVLLREFDGKTHRVQVLASGFLWDGREMRSLSAIAREITGVRWNGPAFFGLRAGSEQP